MLATGWSFALVRRVRKRTWAAVPRRGVRWLVIPACGVGQVPRQGAGRAPHRLSQRTHRDVENTEPTAKHPEKLVHPSLGEPLGRVRSPSSELLPRPAGGLLNLGLGPLRDGPPRSHDLFTRGRVAQLSSRDSTSNHRPAQTPTQAFRPALGAPGHRPRSRTTARILHQPTTAVYRRQEDVAGAVTAPAGDT